MGDPSDSAASRARLFSGQNQPSANYNSYLKVEFSKMIDHLPLSEVQRDFLRLRWLDQVLWMEDRASKSRNWYYRLRLTTIVGGVFVPIMVSLNTGENLSKDLSAALRYATIGLGAVVATSSAVEEFFHYGERWRHYRRSAESLKTQGWQFFHLTGPYAAYGQEPAYDAAFKFFASQIEEIIQRDVEVYSTQVVRELPQETAPALQNLDSKQR